MKNREVVEEEFRKELQEMSGRKVREGEGEEYRGRSLE